MELNRTRPNKRLTCTGETSHRIQTRTASDSAVLEEEQYKWYKDRDARGSADDVRVLVMDGQMRKAGREEEEAWLRGHWHREARREDSMKEARRSAEREKLVAMRRSIDRARSQSEKDGTSEEQRSMRRNEAASFLRI